MDEHLPSRNSDPTKEIVQTTVESERWHALVPNLPSSDHDLLPQELSQDHLGLIITALKDLPLPTDSESDISKESMDLGETGLLKFIGHGESKLCYSLERDGRKMAVILQGYQSELGVQIPEDPYLTKIADTPSGGTWEYSSLRTYAMLPLPDNRAIRLQEFGEPVGISFKSAATMLRGALSRRAVTSYIAQHIPGAKLGKGTKTDFELQQSRHLLTKPGHSQAVFIDIPVEQRH